MIRTFHKDKCSHPHFAIENGGLESYPGPHAEALMESNPETLPRAAEGSISFFFSLGLPAISSLYQ